MAGLNSFLVPFFMLAIAPCGLAVELQPSEAVYTSKLKGFNVHVKRRLQVQDDTMTIRVDVKKFWFAVHERSVLLYHDDGLLYPDTHRHRRRGTSHEHDKDLVFDWAENTVIDLLEQDRKPLPVDRPCYDKLGYQIQMRLDLMRAPDLQSVEYCVTNGIRNRIYSFHRLSDEVLETPVGKLNTIKFRRKGDDDGRQVFIWVAADWDYLLVRLDQTRKPGEKPGHLVLDRATIAGQTVHGLADNAAPVEAP